MQEKHLIIPQQINPFGTILKGVTISKKKKASLFQISKMLQQVASTLSSVNTHDLFYLIFGLLHRKWITYLLYETQNHRITER